MTDKQKEAIERLKRIDIKFFLSGMNEQSNYIVDEADKVNKAIETALNLIQTQQAEIEQLKNKNKHQSKEIQKAVDYTFELNTELEKKDKIIDEIQKEVRDHIGFENRLKRDNKEPDLFNQGRFYVANNINNILKGK